VCGKNAPLKKVKNKDVIQKSCIFNNHIPEFSSIEIEQTEFILHYLIYFFQKHYTRLLAKG
jgi:hypothetical protein